MFSVVIKVNRSLLAVAACIGYIYYSTFRTDRLGGLVHHISILVFYHYTNIIYGRVTSDFYSVFQPSDFLQGKRSCGLPTPARHRIILNHLILLVEGIEQGETEFQDADP